MSQRRSIGGPLDLSALKELADLHTYTDAAQKHRPHDVASLRRSALELHAQGLTGRDIAQALRLDLPATLELLRGGS